LSDAGKQQHADGKGEVGNFDLGHASQNPAIPKDSVEAQSLDAEAPPTVQSNFEGKK
jgi:hypothetical protein